MIGHHKTVSYVRFVDSSTLVSSSTDNTLKLWDLSMSISGINETPLHSFMGHTNVKNFVGLSVSDGYIATGSETNEVCLLSLHKYTKEELLIPFVNKNREFRVLHWTGFCVPQGISNAGFVVQVQNYRPCVGTRSRRCLAVHILSLLAGTVVDLSCCKLHRQYQDFGDGMNQYKVAQKQNGNIPGFGLV
jgi:hypothetical protein